VISHKTANGTQVSFFHNATFWQLSIQRHILTTFNSINTGTSKWLLLSTFNMFCCTHWNFFHFSSIFHYALLAMNFRFHHKLETNTFRFTPAKVHLNQLILYFNTPLHHQTWPLSDKTIESIVEHTNHVDNSSKLCNPPGSTANIQRPRTWHPSVGTPQMQPLRPSVADLSPPMLRWNQHATNPQEERTTSPRPVALPVSSASLPQPQPVSHSQSAHLVTSRQPHPGAHPPFTQSGHPRPARIHPVTPTTS